MELASIFALIAGFQNEDFFLVWCILISSKVFEYAILDKGYLAASVTEKEQLSKVRHSTIQKNAYLFCFIFVIQMICTIYYFFILK